MTSDNHMHGMDDFMVVDDESLVTAVIKGSSSSDDAAPATTTTTTTTRITADGVPLLVVTRCLLLLCCCGAIVCYASQYIWLPFRETDLYAWAPQTLSYRAFLGTADYIIPQDFIIPNDGLQLCEDHDDHDDDHHHDEQKQKHDDNNNCNTMFPAMQVFLQRGETYRQFHDRVLSNVIPFVRANRPNNDNNDNNNNNNHNNQETAAAAAAQREEKQSRYQNIPYEFKDFKRRLHIYNKAKQQQQIDGSSTNAKAMNYYDYGEELTVKRFHVLVQVLPFPKLIDHHHYDISNHFNINMNDNDDWMAWFIKTNHPVINITLYSDTQVMHQLYGKDLEPMPYERSYTSSPWFHLLMGLPLLLLCVNQTRWNGFFRFLLPTQRQQQQQTQPPKTTTPTSPNTFLFNSPRQALFRPFPTYVLHFKRWLVDPLAIVICYLEACHDLDRMGTLDSVSRQRMTRTIGLLIMTGMAVAAMLTLLAPPNYHHTFQHHHVQTSRQSTPQSSSLKRRTTGSNRTMLMINIFWSYVSILIPILQAFVLFLITYATCKYETMNNVRLSSFSMQRAILSQFLLSGIWTDICWRFLMKRNNTTTNPKGKPTKTSSTSMKNHNHDDSVDTIHAQSLVVVSEESIVLDRATMDAGISKFITSYLFYSAAVTKMAESAASHVGGYGGLFGFLNDRYIVQLALRGRFGLDERPYPLEPLLLYVPRSIRWAGMATVLLMELGAIGSWWHFFYHLPIWFLFMTGSSLSIGVPFRADLLFGVVGETTARNIWHTLESFEFLRMMGLVVVMVWLIPYAILMIQRRRSITKTQKTG